MLRMGNTKIYWEIIILILISCPALVWRYILQLQHIHSCFCRHFFLIKHWSQALLHIILQFQILDVQILWKGNLECFHKTCMICSIQQVAVIITDMHSWSIWSYTSECHWSNVHMQETPGDLVSCCRQRTVHAQRLLWDQGHIMSTLQRQRETCLCSSCRLHLWQLV